MEKRKIANLRKRQFALFNISVLFCFIISYILIYVGVPLNIMLKILGMISAVTVIIDLLKKPQLKISYYLFPFIEEIVEYEKEKLGHKWYKKQRKDNIISLLFACFLIIIGFSIPLDTTFNVQLFVPLLLFNLMILIFSNVGFYLRIVEIDKSN